MGKIKVVIAGIGSCASSLVQYIWKSKHLGKNEKLHGVSAQIIGGYKIEDIEIVGGFDIDKNKIGKTITEAIYADVNKAIKHVDNIKNDSVVEAGLLDDGMDGYLLPEVKIDDQCRKILPDTIVEILKRWDADVLVCFLPTGSYKDVYNYSQIALKAKVAFINGTPELIANDPTIGNAFKIAGVPLLGDDMRSHLGATALHTDLIELMHSRGIEVKNTYQLNFGGNADFMNLSSPLRSNSKKKSKRKALSFAGIDASNVAAGPNGYIKYLMDNKICYLRLEGISVLESPVNIEVKLEVEDSPNAAGVIVSAIRIAKTAQDKKMSGVISEVCAFLFKSPVEGCNESEARVLFNRFIRNTNSN